MLNDLMGLTDNDYIYNQSRAHSADIWFLKARAWFWAITTATASLLIGNICGVFGINFFGSLFHGLGMVFELF